VEGKLIATSMTPQSLYYLPPGRLHHVLVVAGERSRRMDEEVADATRALREMISSGRLSKWVPIKIGGELQTVEIVQEGPISFAESTTMEQIFAEDDNRMLSVYTDERVKQTGAVTKRQAAESAGEGGSDAAREAILLRHHAAQRLLRRKKVVIPFAFALEEEIPTIVDPENWTTS
jgi:hypothetical protein